MKGSEVRYLSRGDVEGLGLSGLGVLDIVAGAFAEKGRQTIEMPPKIGIHPREDAFIHAMPAYLSERDVAGLKWVSGYPTNARHEGVPYLHGLLVLSEAETGRPLSIMDATWITEVRTAAVSVLGIRALLGREPHTAAIVGCGRQGHVHLDLLAAAFPGLRAARLYDPVPAAAHGLAERVAGRLEAVVTAGVPDCAAGADVVVTCAPIVRDPQPALDRASVAPGAVVCAVDFDATVQGAIAEAAGAFVVDDVVQYRYYREQGHFGDYPADPVELCDLLEAGAGAPSGVASYVPLGVALADMAVAAHVHEAAASAGAGVLLPLWARTQPALAAEPV
jgi:ornithine cyclodeaminase/alanine dehydrogenase